VDSNQENATAPSSMVPQAGAAAALALALALPAMASAGPQHRLQWWGLGKVHPKGPKYIQTWDMAKSTGIMICNNSGQVDAHWAARWGMVDIDWNSDKRDWSRPHPMDAEENMLKNAQAIQAVDPSTITWVYRNGIKALPWMTTVREKLEDKAHWGWFMAKKGCMPTPGHYVCGANATDNLYHDFEQTPHGDCGKGIECGEYVFNHMNSSLRPWLIQTMFLGNATGGGNKAVSGFYVDDGWSAKGPSEMDKDAVAKMGMTTADVTAMITAWSANVAAWRQAIYDAGLFEWFMVYGGQQTAPGWSQSEPNATCLTFMERNCGATSPSQNGTMFFGYSRYQHSQAWGNASIPGQSYGSLLSPMQECVPCLPALCLLAPTHARRPLSPLCCCCCCCCLILTMHSPLPACSLAAFLITRGPFAWFGCEYNFSPSAFPAVHRC
jgi:hypothetical protein